MLLSLIPGMGLIYVEGNVLGGIGVFVFFAVAFACGGFPGIGFWILQMFLMLRWTLRYNHVVEKLRIENDEQEASLQSEKAVISHEKAAAHERYLDSTLDLDMMIQGISKKFKFYSGGVLTDAEYVAEREAVVKQFSDKPLRIPVLDALDKLIDLKTLGALEQEDIIQIKNTATTQPEKTV